MDWILNSWLKKIEKKRAAAANSSEPGDEATAAANVLETGDEATMESADEQN